jgi:hypothetical protein
MEELMKKKISERALIARINRKFTCEKLHKARPGTEDKKGHYYIVDQHTVSKSHVDLVKLGREMGVLQDWEELRTEAENREFDRNDNADVAEFLKKSSEPYQRARQGKKQGGKPTSERGQGKKRGKPTSER